eukprot:TRINITY_DN10835_c0_g1_i3.p1 TRINITY_DN10835_c0_g1~~TRINITY_DN10835_c0_g1_i3.p1  ORF type:complete len:317 (+),score=121.62 TRINITY_DN10835_c0_g1_i3:26-952(+)
MEVAHKTFERKTAKGTIAHIVRENYLRSDITCKIVGCPVCKSKQKTGSDGWTSPAAQSKLLLDNASHILIPDIDFTISFLELIESPDILDLVFLKTVLNEVQYSSLRQYSRIKTLLKDARRRFVLFNNENFAETFTPKKDGEITIDRNRRALFEAVKWYTLHLIEIGATSKPLVFVTDDFQLEEMCQHLPHVSVMSSQEYVRKFQFSTSLLELYDSLNQVFLQKKENKKNLTGSVGKSKNPMGEMWEEYFPPEILAAGVKSLNLFRGSFQVSSFNLNDAMVRLDGTHGVFNEIYVPKEYRNRAKDPIR